MKILHVVPYFPPGRIGGVGEVAANLHRGLLAAGHTSAVITAGESPNDPTVSSIASTPAGFVMRVARFAYFARGFDLVHCHAGEAIALAVAMRLCRVKTPILATYHVGYRGMASSHRPFEIEGRTFGRSWANWRYRNIGCRAHQLIDTIMLRLASHSSFISKSSAVDILGPDAAVDATIIYNAPSPASPTATAEPEAEPADLLFVGTSSVRKRLELLPFVLRDIRIHRPRTRLRLIGVRPEERPDLVQLLRDLGQSRAVLWEGHLRSKDIVAFYRAATILLVPSAYEGLPMVILEAFRCGLPCVATRVSGHPEVIEDGVTGFLVEKDSPGEMADRCLAILKDRTLRTQLSEGARSMVADNFNIKTQLKKYLELYEALRSE